MVSETDRASVDPIDNEDENPAMTWNEVSKKSSMDGVDQDDPDADENDEQAEEVKDDGVDQAQPLYDDADRCERGEDCPLHPYNICIDHVCKHKTIFPIYPREFLGIIILPILLALANVGGIGGGGVIIPITMACFEFTTKEAIAISGFTILAGAVARFTMDINKKHPEKDATIVDYGIIIVMMPLVLAGSFIGVLVNLSFPGIILSAVLTLILIGLTY